MIGIPIPYVCPSPSNRLTCTGLVGPAGRADRAALPVDPAGTPAAERAPVGVAAALSWWRPDSRVAVMTPMSATAATAMTVAMIPAPRRRGEPGPPDPPERRDRVGDPYVVDPPQ